MRSVLKTNKKHWGSHPILPDKRIKELKTRIPGFKKKIKKKQCCLVAGGKSSTGGCTIFLGFHHFSFIWTQQLFNNTSRVVLLSSFPNATSKIFCIRCLPQPPCQNSSANFETHSMEVDFSVRPSLWNFLTPQN